MIEIACRCGSPLRAAESVVNVTTVCPSCKASLIYLSAEPLAEGTGAADFDLSLVIEAGPDRVGEEFALGGVADISVGKLDDRHLRLSGPKVSRRHCSLKRVDFGPSRWTVTDTGSANGVFVNGERVSEREIRAGDRLIAHLGGFVAGVLLASLWLLTRQVHAHGADLISTIIGPKAAKLIRQG